MCRCILLGNTMLMLRKILILGLLSGIVSCTNGKDVNINENSELIFKDIKLSVIQGEMLVYVPDISNYFKYRAKKFQILNKPNWLNFNLGVGTMYGAPKAEDVGKTNNVVVYADVGNKFKQNIQITVIENARLNNKVDKTSQKKTNIRNSTNIRNTRGSTSSLPPQVANTIVPSVAVSSLGAQVSNSTKDAQYFDNHVFSPVLENAKLTVKAILHPGKTIDLNKSTPVQFGLPLPRNMLFEKNRVMLKYQGKELVLASSVTNNWPSIEKGESNKSIRSLKLTTEFVFKNYQPVEVEIYIGSKNKKKLHRSIRSSELYSLVSQGVNPREYAQEPLSEPKVYVTLSANWLSASLFRGRTTPLHTSDKYSWFDTAYEQFGKTMVNDLSKYVRSKNKINYITNAEPWLFDRAFTLWGLYIRSGEVKWLRHAHRATVFYASKVNDKGFFSLKTYDDLKYSYGLSILTNTMITGDVRNNNKLDALIRAVKKWRPVYSNERRFWTERHQAYAFKIWLTAWELTGEDRYLDEVKRYINIIRSHQIKPPFGWKRDGGLLHTEASHEGDDNLDPVASPWMTALLAEGIFRYAYLTDDKKAYKILAEFGDWVEKYALYDAVVAHPQLAGIIVPKYLFSSTYQSDEGGAWVDLEHGCDVAGLVAKSRFAKKKLNQAFNHLTLPVKQLMNTCQYAINRWHRVDSDRNHGLAVWRLNPPRKFNWWFGSSLDLPWFLLNIDKK